MYPRRVSHSYAEMGSAISAAWQEPDRPQPPSVSTARYWEKIFDHVGAVGAVAGALSSWSIV
jgi:hypothetical protein